MFGSPGGGGRHAASSSVAMRAAPARAIEEEKYREIGPG